MKKIKITSKREMSFRLQDNPCKNCKERAISCHSTCDKYLTWRKGFQEETQKLKNHKKQAFIGYLFRD